MSKLNQTQKEFLETVTDGKHWQTLKKAFEALTPGRQRAYNLFFNAAKQSATRYSRIDSYTERILNKKGINDCVCGLSKRMPGCDGSHKQLNGLKN